MRKIPAHLRVACGVTVCFALAVTVLAWAIGGKFLLPSERMSAALGFSAALPLGMGMLAYIVTQVALIIRGKSSASFKIIGSHITCDMALLILFIAVTYLHFNLKMWVPIINPAQYDMEYMASDSALQWLVDLLTWTSTMLHVILPEHIRWYQMIFLSTFIIAFCYFVTVRNLYYPRFAIGIMLVLSLGGLSYLIAPAVGPFIYGDGNNVLATQAQGHMYYAYQKIELGGVTWINRWGNGYFTGSLAAMPSLHIAHMTVMTYYMIKSRAFLAPLFVFFWCFILIDSVAHRWHYVVDAPAGLALAFVAIWLTDRLLRRYPATETVS